MDDARLAAWLQSRPAAAAASGQLSERERLLLDPLLDPRGSFGTPITPAANVEQPLLYANFNNVQLSVGLGSALALDVPPGGTRRVYFFIVNTHPTQIMFISFAIGSSLVLGVPILNNFGFMELNVVVPQDAVYLIANGAATTGVMLFANKAHSGNEA